MRAQDSTGSKNNCNEFERIVTERIVRNPRESHLRAVQKSLERQAASCVVTERLNVFSVANMPVSSLHLTVYARVHPFPDVCAVFVAYLDPVDHLT